MRDSDYYPKRSISANREAGSASRSQHPQFHNLIKRWLFMNGKVLLLLGDESLKWICKLEYQTLEFCP